MDAPTDTAGRPPIPEPVDWALAERVAVSVAGRSSRPPASLQPSDAEMGELVARAEQLVGDHTGLRPPTPATARVVSREDWARANIASFRRLLLPIWERWVEARPEATKAAASGAIGPKVAATQMGALLGWMSGRVLGQYDVLVAADPTDDESSDGSDSGDAVYMVGPNLAALEQKYAFPPDQFRLWVALHEVTHRAQFRGVPWMRDHYLGLVDSALVVADPDPTRLWNAVRSALGDRDAARSALRDGGAVALLAGPEQREVLGRIAGLMSLLEGHGDVTMDRAGAHLLPDSPRFSHVLRMRRATASPLTRVVQRLIGLEAKLDQYRAGEAFIAEVERTAGAEVLERCWEAPEYLPTLEEVRAPDRWVARIRSDADV